jgi:hypothetical protein
MDMDDDDLDKAMATALANGNMAEFDKLMGNFARQQKGGQIVPSLNANCDLCGKPCKDAGSMCVMKWAGIYNCAKCDPAAKSSSVGWSDGSSSPCD